MLQRRLFFSLNLKSFKTFLPTFYLSTVGSRKDGLGGEGEGKDSFSRKGKCKKKKIPTKVYCMLQEKLTKTSPVMDSF